MNLRYLNANPARSNLPFDSSNARALSIMQAADWGNQRLVSASASDGKGNVNAMNRSVGDGNVVETAPKRTPAVIHMEIESPASRFSQCETLHDIDLRELGGNDSYS